MEIVCDFHGKPLKFSPEKGLWLHKEGSICYESNYLLLKRKHVLDKFSIDQDPKEILDSKLTENYLVEYFSYLRSNPKLLEVENIPKSFIYLISADVEELVKNFLNLGSKLQKLYNLFYSNIFRFNIALANAELLSLVRDAFKRGDIPLSLNLDELINALIFLSNFAIYENRVNIGSYIRYMEEVQKSDIGDTYSLLSFILTVSTLRERVFEKPVFSTVFRMNRQLSEFYVYRFSKRVGGHLWESYLSTLSSSDLDHFKVLLAYFHFLVSIKDIDFEDLTYPLVRRILQFMRKEDLDLKNGILRINNFELSRKGKMLSNPFVVFEADSLNGHRFYLFWGEKWRFFKEGNVHYIQLPSNILLKNVKKLQFEDILRDVERIFSEVIGSKLLKEIRSKAEEYKEVAENIYETFYTLALSIYSTYDLAVEIANIINDKLGLPIIEINRTTFNRIVTEVIVDFTMEVLQDVRFGIFPIVIHKEVARKDALEINKLILDNFDLIKYKPLMEIILTYLSTESIQGKEIILKMLSLLVEPWTNSDVEDRLKLYNALAAIEVPNIISTQWGLLKALVLLIASTAAIRNAKEASASKESLIDAINSLSDREKGAFKCQFLLFSKLFAKMFFSISNLFDKISNPVGTYKGPLPRTHIVERIGETVNSTLHALNLGEVDVDRVFDDLFDFLENLNKIIKKSDAQRRLFMELKMKLEQLRRYRMERDREEKLDAFREKLNKLYQNKDTNVIKKEEVDDDWRKLISMLERKVKLGSRKRKIFEETSSGNVKPPYFSSIRDIDFNVIMKVNKEELVEDVKVNPYKIPVVFDEASDTSSELTWNKRGIIYLNGKLIDKLAGKVKSIEMLKELIDVAVAHEKAKVLFSNPNISLFLDRLKTIEGGREAALISAIHKIIEDARVDFHYSTRYTKYWSLFTYLTLALNLPPSLYTDKEFKRNNPLIPLLQAIIMITRLGITDFQDFFEALSSDQTTFINNVLTPDVVKLITLASRSKNSVDALTASLYVYEKIKENLFEIFGYDKGNKILESFAETSGGDLLKNLKNDLETLVELIFGNLPIFIKEEILQRLERSKNLLEFLDRFNLYKKKFRKHLFLKKGGYKKVKFRLEYPTPGSLIFYLKTVERYKQLIVRLRKEVNRLKIEFKEEKHDWGDLLEEKLQEAYIWSHSRDVPAPKAFTGYIKEFPKIDLIIHLDLSGSMMGEAAEKIMASAVIISEALKDILKQYKGKIQLTIMAFGTEVMVIKYPKEEIVHAKFNIFNLGGTAIFETLYEGIKNLKDDLLEDSHKVVIIFTDTYDSEEDLRLAPRFIGEINKMVGKFSIYTMSTSGEFMDEIKKYSKQTELLTTLDELPEKIINKTLEIIRERGVKKLY
ncbi:MAG: hypothetical protein ACP6IP_10420 [Candidatus Njordarchaeia archaeon]